MKDTWWNVLDRVLRPARPALERVLRECTPHLERRAARAIERARAIARCEARIEAARSDVFAANDGIVGRRMTELEREWRTLSRVDPDEGLMDLWVRIAPAAWIDRKRWRDAAPGARFDAAIALAADPDGVERAEAAALALRAEVAPRVAMGSRIRWSTPSGDLDHARLFEGLAGAPRSDLVAEASERFPERPLLARAIAHAAGVQMQPLLDLWRTGYVLAGFDATGIALELHPV